jgi:hypothetical protein
LGPPDITVSADPWGFHGPNLAGLALLVLEPMRRRAMAEELFPEALGITRV